MTLKEAIEERKGQKVKIGSGNGFIFCGEITDDLPVLIDKLSEEEYSRITDRLKKLNNYLSRFEHFWNWKLENKMDEFYKNVHSKNLPIDMIQQKHKKLLDQFEKAKAKDMRTTQNGIALLNKRISEWKPFTGRKVKEIYPSLEGGEIIIFKGYESGKYWMYEEFEEDKKNEKMVAGNINRIHGVIGSGES